MSKTSTTTNTTQFTLYEILQVSPQASLEDIKSSFYRLARQHHPDKQIQQNQQQYLTSVSNSSSKIDTSKTTNCHFPDIQRAWELLRDPNQRKVYDQELLQQRLQYDSRHHGAISLDFKDLESAIDEETQEVFFVYDCRCGEEIHIDNDRIQGSSRKNDTTNNTNKNVLLVDCPGCCFVYKVHWMQ
jgi:curved DNA-binding protein CbpA